MTTPLRFFPLSSGMVADYGGFRTFFTNILPVPGTCQRQGQVAGRFNLRRSLELRPSTNGTMVLFYVPKQGSPPSEEERVVAHARLNGGVEGPHRDPDEFSDPDSIGYFLVEVKSICYLETPLSRDQLPWQRAFKNNKKECRLNLSQFKTWSLDATEEQIKTYLAAAGSL